ncbi:unnamed protein product [Moneuplotes crassus]|uniref:Uncharacterized protein n=1 Tax=Euplotes crassus TaxID=5936 RepID=A0AAD1XNM7_EUPCR|nr:unnamed protein product [Moneuplotes crassus]
MTSTHAKQIRRSQMKRNKLKPFSSVIEADQMDQKCFQDIDMDEVKNFKISDFQYGNEIPDFLGFIDKKSSYWEVFYRKLMNNQEDKTLVDYINIQKDFKRQTNSDKRKSKLKNFLNRSQANAGFSSFAYPAHTPLLDSIKGFRT